MKSETVNPVSTVSIRHKQGSISFPALFGGCVTVTATTIVLSISLVLLSLLFEEEDWLSRWGILLLGLPVLSLLAGGLFAAGFANKWPVGHATAVGFCYQFFFIFGLMFQSEAFLEELRDQRPLVVALVFSPVLAALGGLITVVLDSTGYRASWIYRTSQGREILATGPRRNPWAALILNGLGLMLLMTCWIPILPIILWVFLLISGSIKEAMEAFRLVKEIEPHFLIPSMFALGLACRMLARKRSSLSAEDALKTGLPPVVFLRSFQDDGLAMEHGSWFELTQSIKALRNKTVEQRLAKAVGEGIPFVAIGRPGEELPELGAARMYVSDDDWQAVVSDLVSRAVLVILQGGRSPGLLWELRHVGDQGDLARVVLSLPIPQHRNRFIPRRVIDRAYREGIYREFRGWAEGHLPASLPEKIGESSFIYFSRVADPNQLFNEVWAANCLNARFRPQPSIPISGFLNDLKKDKTFARQPLFSWPIRVLLWIVLISVVVLLAIRIFFIVSP